MKVYVDMDGVLADFERGFQKAFGISPNGLSDKVEDEYKVKMQDFKFYEGLDPYPGAKSFIKSLQKMFGKANVEILTAVSRIGTVENAKQKRNWLNKHISSDIKMNWTQRSVEKAQYAKSDTLLIDDRKASTVPFQRAGGQVILHTEFTRTLKEASRLNMTESLYSFMEYTQQLDEVAIQFNGKNYPPFNQVVIMAGGAGSGKGFIQQRLVNIEGKILDVDAVKSLAMRSTILAKKIKDETGYDLSKFDLKKPENVAIVHTLLSDVYNITGKKESALFTSIATADPRRKPNIIFDVTLKDLRKMDKISKLVTELGYEKTNIHIVWVVNKFEVAMQQNAKRDRVVPSEIMLVTHEGAALTMKKLLTMGKSLQKYMNGEIYLAFNQVKVDSDLEFSDAGGSYVKAADYIKVKSSGSSVISNLDDQVTAKIKSYVPGTETW